jgi:hypothetical protein
VKIFRFCDANIIKEARTHKCQEASKRHKPSIGRPAVCYYRNYDYISNVQTHNSYRL